MQERYNFSNLEADFKKYISSGIKILGRNTIKNYMSDLRYFLGWYNMKAFNGTPPDFIQDDTQFLGRISEPIVRSYLVYLQASDLPEATVKRRTSSLSTFLKYCVNSGFISENFLKTMKNSDKIQARVLETKKKDVGVVPIDETLQKGELRGYSQIKPPTEPDHSYLLTRRQIFFAGLAVLTIIFMMGLHYAVTSPKGQSLGVFQPQKSSDSGRVLTYKGRLTDSLGNPISTKTDVRFKLYRSPLSNGAIFESNSCVVYPDVNGNFKISIGSDKRTINSLGCDKKIPDGVFSTSLPLYLGVTVGSNAEMKPREQISNVSLATSALQLNGLEAGEGPNAIPYIGNNGEILLAAEAPSINASAASKDFKITSNQSLVLQTANDGDVILSATGSGKIRFMTGNTNTENLVIAENGNIGVGTLNPSYFKLEVSGSVGPSITKTYSLGAPNRLWDSLYVSRICFDEQEKNCTSGLSDKSSSSSATLKNYTGSDILIGLDATASANIKLSGTKGNSSFIRTGYLGINTTDPQSALDVMGTATFGGNVIDITTHNNEDLRLEANGSGKINLSDDTMVGGTFAAGTNVTSGTTFLDIGGNPTSNALCHSSQNGTDNEQIVDCSSTPVADFAEMYPVEDGADYGDVMSIGPEEVKTTDGQYIRKLVASQHPSDQHTLGVISNNYGDFISVGHNLREGDNPKPIALKGRVPVKISVSSRPVKAGDYLTTSSDRGKAVKATKPGVVIGQALEDWDPLSGKNQIMTFVNTAYAVPEASNDPIEVLKEAANSISNVFIVKEKIISPVIETDTLIAKEVSAETASISGTLTVKDASISGTLTADNIDSKNIKDLENRLTGAVKKTDYSKDLNDIQKTLGDIKNSQLPNTSLYPQPPKNLVADSGMEGLFNNLIVSGDTSLFNLNVHEKIYTLQDELKISALSSINFLDGAIVMTRDGDITTKGTVTAKAVKTQNLTINNEAGQNVASVDASGEARFARLSLDTSLAASSSSTIIASDKNFEENGLQLPAIQTKKEAAGVGIVPENQSRVAIYNDGLRTESLIFLTPTDATDSAGLSVATKETCDNKTNCKPYFTVSAGSIPHPDIHFNWFILNSK